MAKRRSKSSKMRELKEEIGLLQREVQEEQLDKDRLRTQLSLASRQNETLVAEASRFRRELGDMREELQTMRIWTREMVGNAHTRVSELLVDLRVANQDNRNANAVFHDLVASAVDVAKDAATRAIEREFKNN